MGQDKLRQYPITADEQGLWKWLSGLNIDGYLLWIAGIAVHRNWMLVEIHDTEHLGYRANFEIDLTGIRYIEKNIRTQLLQKHIQNMVNRYLAEWSVSR